MKDGQKALPERMARKDRQKGWPERIARKDCQKGWPEGIASKDGQKGWAESKEQFHSGFVDASSSQESAKCEGTGFNSRRAPSARWDV